MLMDALSALVYKIFRQNLATKLVIALGYNLPQ